MKSSLLFLLALYINCMVNGQGNQIPEVVSNSKIGDNLSGFPDDSISNSDRFGYSVARIGDINGDDIEDIAIGAPFSDKGGTNRGCVWICIMDDDYTIDSYKSISSGKHGMSALSDNDYFGSSIAGIGDINGDDIPDIAVGAPGNDDDGNQSGAIWILCLNSNGTIKSSPSPKEISDTEIGGYNLAADDSLGISVAGIGDLDGNGVPDIAVGANGSDASSSSAGCTFIIFLKSDGDITSSYQIYSGLGLSSGDQFGYALSVYPDVDSDGLNEILVGIPYDDNTAGTNFGSVLLLRLNDDGTVKSPYYTYDSPVYDSKEYFIIPAGNVQFGRSLSITDFNKDGRYDIIAGAPGDQAFYSIILDENLNDVAWRKFGGDYAWDFTFPANHLQFAFSLSSISDLDEDGQIELLVGTPRADDGGTDRGIIYVLKLDTLDLNEEISEIAKVHKISDISGKFTGTLDNTDAWGGAVCSLGDLDGDGNEDIAVTTVFDDDGSTNRGAVYILFLDSSGVTISFQKISDTEGNFTGTLTNDCRFGSTITNMGDINGDDIVDIAVGAIQDDDGGTDRGAVWILFLDTDGTVKSHQKISETSGGATSGGFGGTLSNGCLFGAVGNIGDINNDGINDLAVGAMRDDDNGTDRGAVYILFLNSSGKVTGYNKISDSDPNSLWNPTFANSDNFGSSCSGIGDFNNDGYEDLLVSARAQNGTGAVYIVYLDSSGEVLGYTKINNSASNFPETLISGELFGTDVKSCGDLDDNGSVELIIGAQNFNGIGTQRGSAWLCYMQADGTVLSAKRIGDYSDDFYGLLDNADVFGVCVGVFNTDLNNDGYPDFIIGARNDDDGGDGRGSIYILSLNRFEREKKYAKLYREISGTYYSILPQDKKLRFRFDGEYSSSQLRWNIYNNEHIIVGSHTDAPSYYKNLYTNTTYLTVGENLFTIDLSCNGIFNNNSGLGTLPQGFYVLEVLNEKNEKLYLRFYTNGISCMEIPLFLLTE